MNMIKLLLQDRSTRETIVVINECWFSGSAENLDYSTDLQPDHWYARIARLNEDNFQLIVADGEPVPITSNSQLQIGSQTFTVFFEKIRIEEEITICRPPVNARSWYALNRGRRKSQQDAVGCFTDGKQQLWIVADGVGGGREPDLGSRASVQMVAHAFFVDSTNDSPDSRLIHAIQTASRRLLDYASERYGGDKRVAAAIVVLALVDDKWYLTHVGDCRAYYRQVNGRFSQMTIDYTFAQKAIDEGVRPEVANHQPDANDLASAVGWKRLVASPVRELRAQPHDRWLLCSDGLTSQPDRQVLISSDELEKNVSDSDIEGVAAKLVKLAFERGGEDNIAALIVEGKNALEDQVAPACFEARNADPQVVRAKSEYIFPTKRRFWERFS